MKKTLGLVLALSLFALPDLARAEDTIDQVSEKLMSTIEEYAGILDSDKANCDKMAKDLSAFGDRNAALFAKVKKLMNSVTPEKKKALKEKYQKREQAATRTMQDGFVACSKNEKFKAAFTKLTKLARP